MWYLSRTPSVSNAKPNDQTLIPLHNSIFPFSDSGLFDEICIVEIRKSPLIDHKNNNKQAETTYSFPSWEWFAYQCTPTQFHCVVVHRVLSESGYRIQVIGVFPEQFLCAKLVECPNQPYASLCTYSCSDNSLDDVPKMNCEDRNPFGTACALLDGTWFYVAGGYKGNPSNIDPSSYLNSAERLNLKTWKWQALQNMFFVVVGSKALEYSAEIYNPSTNSWVFLKSFHNGRLMILTWSDLLGVKLWLWTVLANNPNSICRCRLIGFIPNQIIERPQIKAQGRGWEQFWLEVDGSNAWPVFPAPAFRPGNGNEIVKKGHIYAFSFSSEY
ncbi:influenza virus NS1A-binding protein-like protein [Pyrus ussuriensis x Pyrus communis]|uniref:Influenza virus NS1A-binding protein-like protein n=1 Tax=Pyrus ussuriensis x Pyrus communis TaxID=2448454 RepID=A0A5N5FUR9_9ROSA|nr:influenza virus NS1A-binding protein-like protein [Pyrus ussuriensis x Pyrus communis]